MSEDPEEQPRYCRNCGQQANHAGPYCSRCGDDLYKIVQWSISGVHIQIDERPSYITGRAALIIGLFVVVILIIAGFAVIWA